MVGHVRGTFISVKRIKLILKAKYSDYLCNY